MGMEPFYVLSSLNGVASQRLVRRLCDCKAESRATESEVRALRIPQSLFNSDGTFTTYRAVGCPSCSSAGYKGRFALQEVMVVDDAIRELIANRAPTRLIREAAVVGGMIRLLLAVGGHARRHLNSSRRSGPSGPSASEADPNCQMIARGYDADGHLVKRPILPPTRPALRRALPLYPAPIPPRPPRRDGAGPGPASVAATSWSGRAGT